MSGAYIPSRRLVMVGVLLLSSTVSNPLPPDDGSRASPTRSMRGGFNHERYPDDHSCPELERATRDVLASNRASSSSRFEHTSRLTLAAVGDIIIHRSLYRDARAPSGGYDFKPMFHPIRPMIQEADIAFANQETLVGGEALDISSYPKFNSPRAVGDAMRWAGFDVLNMANNHVLDRGAEGIERATEYLERLRLTPIGVASSREASRELTTFTENGIEVAFLGYTNRTNGLPIPEGRPYLVDTLDLDDVQHDVARGRARADVVVVSLHMGVQYQTSPSRHQKRIARHLATFGVDLVLMHHPHVLQPIEWVEADDHRTLVAYSLGNILSGQVGEERKTGGILNVTFAKHDAHTRIEHVAFEPTWTKSRYRRQYEVVPLDDVTTLAPQQRDERYRTVLERVVF